MIRLDYLILADAVAAVGGKHYIHGGGWDTLATGAFPAVHPTMAVAVRLRVPWDDTNRPTALVLDLLDGGGSSILPDPPGALRGDISVGRPPTLAPGDEQVVLLSFPLNNLRFASPGYYVITLHLNGTEVARAPFRVILNQNQAPAPNVQA
jgi:hypothetical protein